MSKVSKDDIRSWASDYTSLIPAGFFVAMAYRESGYEGGPSGNTNEDNGQVSIGLFQVNQDEADSVGVTGDIQDPQVNTSVIVALMLRNLQALAAKFGFTVDSVPNDIWYYLAASHNAGLGKAEQWLNETGIDWEATKGRHPTFVTIAKGYAQYIGDAAIADTGIIGGGTDPIGGISSGMLVVILIVGAILVEYFARGAVKI